MLDFSWQLVRGQVGLGFDQHQMRYRGILISRFESDQQVNVLLVPVGILEARILEGSPKVDVGNRREVEGQLYPVDLAVHGDKRILRHRYVDARAQPLAETLAEFGDGSVESERFPEDCEGLVAVQGT